MHKALAGRVFVPQQLGFLFKSAQLNLERGQLLKHRLEEHKQVIKEACELTHRDPEQFSSDTQQLVREENKTKK